MSFDICQIYREPFLTEEGKTYWVTFRVDYDNDDTDNHAIKTIDTETIEIDGTVTDEERDELIDKVLAYLHTA